MSDNQRRRPVCRARVVVPDGQGRVLLVRHSHADGRDFWCFPGGGVEPGESFTDAARRELREETGLEIDLQGVFALQDDPAADSCEVIFLARPCGGTAALGSDPERDGETRPVLRALAWVSTADLPAWNALPRGPVARLARGDIAVLALPPG